MAEIDPIYGCLASQHDGLGGTGIACLMGLFGSASGAYEAGAKAWKEALPRLPAATLASMTKGPDLRAWEALTAQCRDLGITLTAPTQPDYPAPLRTLEGPPALLYLRGRWTPEDARAVALVGTRGPTAYGREAAYTLARDFAAEGYRVVSGLAAGIDGAAHFGAMEGGGRTIAVIGCGLDIEYPLENLPVRARIEADDGAQGLVLSEFPPGMQPRTGHFPRRNRLISALSQAVIVVEAGSKSGALLTAALGLHQGKPLFAVPGPIFSAVSAGTTALLRRGASPAASVHDVIRVLEGNAPTRRMAIPNGAEPDIVERAEDTTRPRGKRAARDATRAATNDPVETLWERDDACGLDALAARAVARGLWTADKAPAALLERLLHLELQGRVRRLPGAVYRRT